MGQFQILPRSIPTIEQHGFCLDALVGNSGDQHVLEMVVLGLAIGGVVIDPVVHGVMFLTVAVHQVDHANPTNQAAHSAAVLFFN